MENDVKNTTLKYLQLYQKDVSNKIKIDHNKAYNDLAIEIDKVRQKDIQTQQGYGKPICATLSENKTHITVGNRKYSGIWQTFNDFLISYMLSCFGKDWLPQQKIAPGDNPHPIQIWHQYVLETWLSNKKEDVGIFYTTHTGATRSYFDLAYNLYQIRHNAELTDLIIRRLKNNNDQFPGAYYESFIYNYLIRAGFDIELDDGKDGSDGKHPDCTATCKASGKKYSVEIKACNRKGVLGVKTNATDDDLNIRNLSNILRKALEKPSPHQKLIFIELNLPSSKNNEEPKWVNIINDLVKEKENSFRVKDKAYLFFTNHTAHRELDSSIYGRNVLVLGFNIDDFGDRIKFKTLKESYYAKKKHIDMFNLFASMCIEYNIPATFDGELPEFEFIKDRQSRLLIGNSFYIPDKNGNTFIGMLQNAIILEERKVCVGIYWVNSLQAYVEAICPISEEELFAYRRHPDTFFGVIKPVNRIISDNDPISLFEFFLDCYQNISREELLEIMKYCHDIELLKTLDQEELAVTFCERNAMSVIFKSNF